MAGFNNYYGGYYPNQPNFGAMPDVLNQFKNPYQQQMAMPQPVQMPQMVAANDMIWVLGEVEAMSYPVAPNNTVILWDKNNNTIYVKSVNAQGVPSMRTLDFCERISEKSLNTNDFQGGKFVSMEAFKDLEAKFEALSDEFANISAKQKTKAPKEDKENG